MSIKPLKAPSLKGLKIRCTLCKREPASCAHYEHHKYRIHVHIAGTKKGAKIKSLESRDYDEAVYEALTYRKFLEANNYQDKPQQSIKVVPLNPSTVVSSQPKVSLSLTKAINEYKRFLSGEVGLKYLQKKLSKGHIDETIRYCNRLADNLPDGMNADEYEVSQIGGEDAHQFYISMAERYKVCSFNKCMLSVKNLFAFCIKTMKVPMENPFAEIEPRQRPKKKPISITQEEFAAILEAIDTTTPYQILGGKGERKNHYRPYLKDAFNLAVYTGLRREQLCEVRWSHIYSTERGSLAISSANLKVLRYFDIEEDDDYNAEVPINEQLMNILIELGYNDKKHTTEYILYPRRTLKIKTLMDVLSKAFTHYKNNAGITRPLRFKHLRKTYISYVYKSMGGQTKYLTNHSSDDILKRSYVNTRVIDSIDEGVKRIRIFG
jgi:integrase